MRPARKPPTVRALTPAADGLSALGYVVGASAGIAFAVFGDLEAQRRGWVYVAVTGMLALGWARRLPRTVRIIALFPGWTLAIGAAALGVLIVVTASRLLFAATLVACLLAIAARFRAGEGSQGVLLGSLMVGVLTWCVSAGLVWLWLQAPASEAACRGIDRQPGVRWLPVGRRGQDVAVLGRGDQLVVSCKAWNNLIVYPRVGEPSSLVRFTITAGGVREIEEIALSTDQMAEFMVLGTDGSLVATVLDGHGRHGVAVIRSPLAGAFRLDGIHVLSPGFEPNGLAVDPATGMYAVFGVGDGIAWLDPATFEPTAFTDFVSPLVMDVDSDSRRFAYATTLGGQVVEVDLKTHELRQGLLDGLISGAGVSVPAERPLLAVTDVVGWRIAVVSRSTLRVIRSRRVEFPPRAVAWCSENRILLVGDYLDGSVHAYRPDDLEEIGSPVHVGGNLRRLRYDPSSENVYAASKCGVARIDPGVAWPETDRRTPLR